MGVYYHYINYTKREFFAISALGGGIKFWSIGRTLAARAFELMLAKRNPETQTGMDEICGRWHGDQIAIDGDDYNPDWEQIQNGFRNICPDLIVMLYEVDGFEPIAKAASEDAWLFMELCHLITTGQTPKLEGEMRQVFGERYRQRYAELCQENDWFVPQDLALNAA